MKRLLSVPPLTLALLVGDFLPAQAQPKFTRTEDVIYGRKCGMALTLDVIEPEKKNGAAIFVMVIGGFFSDHNSINPGFYQARMFEQKCREVAAPYKLIVKPGADHGWPGMDKDMEVFADWFDQHLLGVRAKE